jgi:hypothetical protein
MRQNFEPQRLQRRREREEFLLRRQGKVAAVAKLGLMRSSPARKRRGPDLN